MTGPSFRADQRAIVTGASSGIGRAVARGLLAMGTRVALVGRDQMRLEETADGHSEHLLLTCDVRDDNQVRATVTRVEQAWDGVDLLVNSAGLYQTAPLTETSNAMWDDLWRTNVSGTLFPTRAVLPGMLERGHGTIVMISSVAGYRGFANNTAHAATKLAVAGLARALSDEVRRKGVRVVNATIGPVDTPVWAGSGTPLEREDMLTPEETAQAIINAISVSKTQVLEEIVLLPQKGLYH